VSDVDWYGIQEDYAESMYQAGVKVLYDIMLERIYRIGEVAGGSTLHMLPDKPRYKRNDYQTAYVDGFYSARNVLNKCLTALEAKQ